jgi:hypothetical protein
MRRKVLCTMVAAAIGAVASPVKAHHSIAKFDGRRVVKFTGTVTGLRWINPHVSFEVDGSGVRWVVEMQAPTTMMGEGWTRDTLVAGDVITVVANPQREEVAAAPIRRALYLGVILPDGSTLGRVDATDRKGEE